MSDRTSRTVYQARMHRVLEHIDTHLDQALELADLARVASFSPYHFHRLFAAWTGERIGDFVRRRRLELAAARLISQPALPVLSVALGVGFGSAEAFARAFKIHFGVPPTVWRRAEAAGRNQLRNADQARSNLDQAAHFGSADNGDSRHSNQESNMAVRLETFQPVAIAYLRYTGPYGASVDQFWQTRVYPWMHANGLLGRARYGISHDDPSITPADKCRYDACVAVSSTQVLSGKAMRTALAGGKYAVLDYKGTAAHIGVAWAALLRDWLPTSGLQLDARPGFEYYPTGSSFDPATGEFDCQLCIPVAPL